MATIQKRGNSYLIRVSCGYDVKGKQVIQSMTWKPDEKMTEKQIEKELNRQAVMFEDACMKGFQVKAVKFEAFCEEWFEEYAKPNLRNTTYERLLQLRGRVYAAIGHLRMDKITPRQIQAFVNGLSKDGANERTGKPLAPKTIRHNLSLISDVFTYAVKMGVVGDNPCAKVTIPKGEQKEKPFHHDVIQIGNRDSLGITNDKFDVDYWRWLKRESRLDEAGAYVKASLNDNPVVKIATQILKEVAEEILQNRDSKYSNILVHGLIIHCDEPNGTPRLDFRYSIFTDDEKRGVPWRISDHKGLQKMGCYM